MRHETLAPWAEPAPDAGPMTAGDLPRLDDAAWQFELVEGRLVRRAPTRLGHLDVTRKLYRALERYGDVHDLGIVTLPDTGFRLTRPGVGQPAATLGASGTLDGLDVLPGFSHPVADLFS